MGHTELNVITQKCKKWSTLSAKRDVNAMWPNPSVQLPTTIALGYANMQKVLKSNFTHHFGPMNLVKTFWTITMGLGGKLWL